MRNKTFFIAINNEAVYLLKKSRKLISIYFINTSKNEVSKVFEIDFEEEILFATEIQLPEALASTEYLKQGLLVISSTLEWNLIGFKTQGLSHLTKPVLSSLFCGQLKENFPLLNKQVVKAANVCIGDLSFLTLTLYEDVLTFFILKKNEYHNTNNFKVQVKNLSLKSFSFLIPEKSLPIDIAITPQNEKIMKIGLLLQKKQTIIDPNAPKMCLTLVSFFQYNIKENEILPERYSLENLPHTASRITFLQNILILIQSNQIIDILKVIKNKIETEEVQADLILGRGSLESSNAFVGISYNFLLKAYGYKASASKLLIIQEKSGSISSQIIYKNEEQVLFGKDLYLMNAQQNNQSQINFLSLLNKEELKVINIDLQKRKLIQAMHFSLPMEKKWKNCKIYGKNRTSIACLKSA